MAAVALVGGGLFYVAAPGTEQVAINVTDAKGHAVDHVKIFVDGRERCQTSPCVEEVSVGVHQVKVLCDGYEPPAVQAVAVAAGRPGSAGFTLFPSTKAGAGQDLAAVMPAPVDTAERAQAAAPSASPAPVTSERSPAAAQRPRRSAGPAVAASQQCGVAPLNMPPAPSAAAGSDEGFLTINSIPPATCFLDGKAIGPTPVVHVSVHAGVHTVKFVNTDRGLEKTVTVKVDAGETKPAVTRLE
jgi:hypothetical protein